MLNLDTYLKTPPAWAQDGVEDQYSEALEHFGLSFGRNPSTHCPCGGHGKSSDSNVVVYDRGVMCYSQHGNVPRAEVIALAGLTQHETGMSLADLAKREIGRFVAEDQLRSMLEAGIEERLGWAEQREKAAVECLVSWAKRHCADDRRWRHRLAAVCRDQYPCRAYEFWSNGMIAHQRHHVPSAMEELGRPGEPCYTVRILSPRETPRPPLAVRLAPKLAGVSQDLKTSASAGTDRFIAGETHSVAQSSLIAVESIDRPVPGLSGGWKLPSHVDELPRYIDVARPTADVADRVLVLGEFLSDLKTTFAFDDDESFARYVAYLMQPMLVAYMPGLFPGYSFTGPTKSGKSFLAGPFPRVIYRHNAGDPVFICRIPDSDYELAVQFDAHQGTLYAVFDEAIDMTERQAKSLDQLITSPVLISRKMRVGYLTRPNYLTFSFTAVAKSLPPETAGRMLEIHFTESRPAQISEFFLRWRERGAEVLRVLFDAMCSVADITNHDHVPERRPGFGILQRVLKEGFSLQATFGITADEDDILDLICQAYCNNVGTERVGGWRRMSFTTLAQLYSESTRLKATRATMHRKIYTALGHESTRHHPVYRDSGYRWENGGFYEIEIRAESEGKGNKRTSVYVREVKNSAPPPTGTGESQQTQCASQRQSPEDPGRTSVTGKADVESGTVEFDLDSLERDVFKGGRSDD